MGEYLGYCLQDFSEWEDSPANKELLKELIHGFGQVIGFTDPQKEFLMKISKDVRDSTHLNYLSIIAEVQRNTMIEARILYESN